MSLYNRPSIQASLMSVRLQILAILIAFFCSVLSFQGSVVYIYVKLFRVITLLNAAATCSPMPSPA